MKTASIKAAYGRKYKSKAVMLEDWNAGKDFYLYHLARAQLFSIRDVESLKKEGFTGLQFRYANDTKTFILDF